MMTNTLSQKAAKQFAEEWQGKGYEKGDTQKFWLELLQNVLGVQDVFKFIEFEDQVLVENTNFMDGYIPATKVLIEQKSIEKELGKPIVQSDGSLLNPFQQAKKYIVGLPVSKHPRWVVTCNFREIWVYDMEQPNGEPQKILLKNLEKEYYRLQFLVDEGNEHLKREMEVSVKAGELVGVIYDKLLEQYIDKDSPETLRSLNILCVRLVFCLYAEDAGLFPSKTAFHDYLQKYGATDFRRALIDFFVLLDTPTESRDPYLEDDIAAFPYVNGGLFSDEKIIIPRFSDEIKQLLLDKASADFDWSEISPTIFGAVFESTLNPETRRSGGMHYTSIENIHKVIDPLFMNDLRDEFEGILGTRSSSPAKKLLAAFQDKLASLTFLDPACGSGNFLTETFLSLRRLENEVIQAMYGGNRQIGFEGTIKVNISQFYGIEINDFACTVAKTALWIAESQMLKETSSIVGVDLNFLPLKTNAYIHEGNALRMDWASLGAAVAKRSSPATTYDYIIGNPPFVGARLMSKEQKDDLLNIFGKKWKNIGNMDYVSGWYLKAAELMLGAAVVKRSSPAKHIKSALVSTNSITQGEQVANLWKPLVEQYGVQIDFAYRTFRWDSEADIKAHVHCVIIGFSLGTRSSSPANTLGTRSSSPALKLRKDVLTEIKNHTRGYLPHFENNRFQAITFRLYDSVPRSVIEQWKSELDLNKAGGNDRAPREQQLRQLIDQYEDAGIGQCFFRDERVAQIMQDALFFYDKKRYNLIRWCIMPNHVHVLIELIGEWSVATILKGWKSYTAHEANKVLGRKGDFWMPEYFDRYIRNNDHYRNAIDYIDNNPCKAGLVSSPEEYHWCSLGSAGEDDRAPSVFAGEDDRAPRIYLSDNQVIPAANINPYLIDAQNVWIENRNKPLCDVPEMVFGSMANDGGNLILSAEEKEILICKYPQLDPYIKIFLGAEEFINNKKRFCLWFVGCPPSLLRSCPQIWERIERVRNLRASSSRAGTRKMADFPTLFGENRQPDSKYLLVPRVSSERRRYVPMGFLDNDIIASDAVQIIPSATLYHFGVLTSNVHMAWMRVVCGRLKSDYRYSKDIVYNNFPWPHAVRDLLGARSSSPALTAEEKEEIEHRLCMMAGGDDRVPGTAQAILDARAKYPDCSLADLYDEVAMPPELRKAHQENDRAVMAAYGFSPKMTESECVAELFKMYQEIVNSKK